MWRQIEKLVRSWVLGECLHGPARGVAAFAVDVGVSYLSGKLVDDLLEEGIKAAAAGISTESAASIGRYFGVATGLCLFLMRRGNDVSLEQYSEFEVSLQSVKA